MEYGIHFIGRVSAVYFMPINHFPFKWRVLYAKPVRCLSRERVIHIAWSNIAFASTQGMYKHS